MTNNQQRPNQTLGEALETARQVAGLSLRQLAQRASIPQTTVNRLLKDDVERPLPAHLLRLAEVLKTRAADLFLLAGIATPQDRPSLDVMLRTEYGLPPEAIAEAKRDIGRIIEKYDGGASTGRKELK